MNTRPVKGPARSDRLRVVLLVFTVTSILAVSCGYRSPTAALPGGARRIQVMSPDVSRTDEPRLSRWIAAELIRGLTRRGVTVSRSGARAVLHVRVLRISAPAAVMDRGGRALGARSLRIAAELRLSDLRHQTLWRSGLIELEQLWPLPGADTVVAEVARERVLRHLAARLAEEGVDLLLSGL